MTQFNKKRGFAPLLILLIIVVIGGGAYAAVKLSQKSPKVEPKNEMNAAASGETGNGSIRALLSLGKDLSCTYSRTDGNVTMSGTMFLSGTMMRSDFTSKAGASAQVESHMIRNGDTIYVWSGATGSKMTTAAMSDTKTSTESQKSMDLDQKVDYKCVAWSKDDAKFAVPAEINFVDINAMIKVNVNADVKAQGGSCVMCEQISGKAAQAECRKAAGCK